MWGQVWDMGEYRTRDKGAGEDEPLYLSPRPKYVVESGTKRMDLADPSWTVISDGPHMERKEEK